MRGNKLIQYISKKCLKKAQNYQSPVPTCLWWLMHYAWALLGKYCPNLAIISHYVPKACNLTLESNPRWGFHRPNRSFPLICMIITACLVDLEITVWVNFARKWADISRSSIINFLKVFNVLFQGDVDDVVLLGRSACQISCTRLSLHVRLF